MDFKTAEMLINASLLAGGPPVMVIGPNGIGKTEMLKAVALRFKNTLFTTAVEYAGFKQYEHLLVQNKIKNIVISDLQSITLRPPNVRGNVIRLLSSLTSEGTQFELTFSKDRPIEDFRKRKKNYNLNVVVGGTPDHLRTLVREGYHDLLVRFTYVFVERDVSVIDFKKKYELHINPKLKWDKKAFAQVEATNGAANYPTLSPRENFLYIKLQNAMKTLDFPIGEQVKFYRPMERMVGDKKSVNLDSRLVDATL